MKIQRLFVAGSVAAAMTACSGVALADTVSIGGTGSGSHQAVTLQDTSVTTSSNVNVVTISNQSSQASSTGNITAAHNTSVDAVGSGSTGNQSTQQTTVMIGQTGGRGANPTPPDNGGVTPPPVSGPIAPLPGSGNGATAPAGGPGEGSVLGAATSAAGVATLPAVGASQPIDVSALRALYREPVTAAIAPSLVKARQPLDTTLLVVASTLSLIGAIGSAVYAQRRGVKA